MTDLSPKAQEIVDAFYSTFMDKRQDFIIQQLNNVALAAVLRVLADNVAPEKYNSFTPGDAGFDKGRRQKNDCIREAILSIATELEAK